AVWSRSAMTAPLETRATSAVVVQPRPGGRVISMTAADLAAELEAFARACPAGPEMDHVRKEGRRAGDHLCCIEFYCAVIPLVWANTREPSAYWALPSHPSHGHVACPACLRASFGKAERATPVRRDEADLKPLLGPRATSDVRERRQRKQR